MVQGEQGEWAAEVAVCAGNEFVTVTNGVEMQLTYGHQPGAKLSHTAQW